VIECYALNRQLGNKYEQTHRLISSSRENHFSSMDVPF